MIASISGKAFGNMESKRYGKHLEQNKELGHFLSYTVKISAFLQCTL